MQVETKMLDVSWAFAGETGVDFRELVVLLSSNNNLSIFGTDMIRCLKDNAYKTFNKRHLVHDKEDLINFYKFSVSLVLFNSLLTILFHSIYTSTGIHNFNTHEKNVAGVMGFLIICLDLLTLFLEFV